MIFQENDFLKTYNEIDKLWEDSNITKMIPDSFLFTDVMNRLNDFSFDTTELTEKDYLYWSGLRNICWGKKGRQNQTENKNWCTRFLTFYLAYEAEELIIKNSKKYLKLDLIRPENSNAGLLTSDAVEQAAQQESVIDFKTTLANGESTYVEAKTLGALTTVHGAKYVIRHTGLKDYVTNGKIQEFIFFLVGHKNDLDLLYGPNYKYSHNKYIMVLDDSIGLDRGFTRVPSRIDKSIKISLSCAAILKKLYHIDSLIDSLDGGELKAIHLLDKQTANISKTLANNFEPFSTSDPLPSDNIESAKSNLISAANQLVAAVSNTEEENYD